MADLNDLIVLGECAGLNVKDAPGFANSVALAFQDNANPVRSDCDAQLILIVVFRVPVKLAALRVVAVAGEEPTIVKLWCNKKGELSFDDVDAVKPNFECEVDEGAAKGAPIALPAVKLPMCTSVTLFFDAEGKDTSACAPPPPPRRCHSRLNAPPTPIPTPTAQTQRRCRA